MKSQTPGYITFDRQRHFLDEPIKIDDYCRTTVIAEPGSTIIKAFDGPLFIAGMMTEFHNLYVQGQGDRFEGGGIEVRSGNLNRNSWVRFFDCIIEDTKDSCVKFIGDSAGYQSEMRGGTYIPFDRYETPAILLDVGENESNGNRHFTDVKTGSNIFADFGNCDNAQVTACEGGAPAMGVKSKKISFTGNRFHTVMGKDGILRPLVFKGTAHSVVGGTLNTPVTFHESLKNFKFFGPAIGDGNAVIDNCNGIADGNQIYLNTSEFLPLWNGAIGTELDPGQITARKQRQGDKLWNRYVLQVGAGTTLPAGQLEFFTDKAIANAATGSGVARLSGVLVGLTPMAAFSDYCATGIVLLKSTGGLLSGADMAPGDYFEFEVTPEI